MNQSSLLSTAQAAERLAVKESWLRAHTEIPRIKIGKLVRYRLSDLEAYVEEHLEGVL